MAGLEERNLSMFRLNITSALVIIIIIMGYVIYSLHKQNALKSTIISQLNSSIESNNQTIKKLEVDLKKFKQQEPIIKEKIVNRYIKVNAKDNQCESQLQAIDHLLNIYVGKK